MGLLDDAMNSEVNRRAVAAEEERLRKAAEHREFELYADEVLSLVEDFLTRLSGFGSPDPRWNWVACDRVLEFNDPPGDINPVTGKPFRLRLGVGVVVPHRISEPFIYVSAGRYSMDTLKKKKPKQMAKAEDARWRELMRTNPWPRLAIVLGETNHDGWSADWLSVDYRLRGDALRAQILKVRQEGRRGLQYGGRPYWLTPQELAERMVTYLGYLKDLLAA